MTERNEPPRLFAWGDHGVPGEFEGYLGDLETSARWDGGERDFAAEGVQVAANETLARLREETDQFIDAKGHPPKLSHEIRSMLYLLHAYCAKWNKPAPPALLWLTLETLGLKEGRPAPEVERLLRLDVGIIDREAFHQASALDGEADAAGQTLSISELARKVGVSRATVRRWREMRGYRSRRDFVAYTHGEQSPHAVFLARATNRANARLPTGGDEKV